MTVGPNRGKLKRSAARQPWLIGWSQATFLRTTRTRVASDKWNKITHYGATTQRKFIADLRNLWTDDQLPLSGLPYNGRFTEGFSSSCSSLRSSALEFVARSPFIANSGYADNFGSVEELARSLRSGLYLHEHSIPYLSSSNSSLVQSDPSTEHASDHLNAYLLDFFIHGQVQALSAADGIRRGDVWYLLQDFSLTLKTVKSALEQLFTRASKVDETVTSNRTETSRKAEEIDDPEEERIWEESKSWEENGKSWEDDDSSDEDEDSDGDLEMASKPKGITQADWRVYEVVCAATTEFETKFKAMWA